MLFYDAVITMLPVSDPDRAAKFYKEVLGLRRYAFSEDGTEVFWLNTLAMVGLLHRPDTQTESTVLSFEVSNLEDAIAELEEKGVVFEDYDLPSLTTENHIAAMGQERAAWFKDTEGNYLCLHQFNH